MRLTFVTLFPEAIAPYLAASILGRAQQDGRIVVDTVQVRDFATDKHKTVDEAPCGGGAGMIMKVDVLARAIAHACGPDRQAARVILLDARGPVFSQADARELATRERHLVFVCGRYEGIDARVDLLVDEVRSIGDYVLTGGELPALVIADAVARLLPGVLGNADSARDESHQTRLLEHRQYTRPIEHDGVGVPPVLLSGNHKAIDDARRKDALLLTRARRPDLFVQEKKARRDDKLLADQRVAALDPVPAVDD